MNSTGMQCLPHVFEGGRGHLIAATCWDPSDSSRPVWSTSSKRPRLICYTTLRKIEYGEASATKRRTVPIRAPTVARAQRGFPLIHSTR